MEVRDRRKLTDIAISMNPTQVEITRLGRAPDGAGGWIEDQPINLPAQVFRLFISRQVTREVSQEGGRFQIKPWHMVGPWNADVKAGDTFTVGDAHYRVVSLRPIRYLGEIVSHQAVIEEVS